MKLFWCIAALGLVSCAGALVGVVWGRLDHDNALVSRNEFFAAGLLAITVGALLLVFLPRVGAWRKLRRASQQISMLYQGRADDGRPRLSGLRLLAPGVLVASDSGIEMTDGDGSRIVVLWESVSSVSLSLTQTLASRKWYLLRVTYGARVASLIVLDPRLLAAGSGKPDYAKKVASDLREMASRRGAPIS